MKDAHYSTYLTDVPCNAGGTGLGLSICKEFIDAHHGRIWAEHNPCGGSVFNFVIPLEQSHQI